jgi:DNA helicase-2/ATP-dependent DNA helicase PcrA
MSEADQIIRECLDLDAPKSFFLFAGAGSGKTRSLVEVLKEFKGKHAPRLRLSGQKVAIITYTNTACNEIERRLDYDKTFVVSTIHSFAWSLIQHYTADIRASLQIILTDDISDLELKQSKGRGGQASIDRAAKIESKTRRLQALPLVHKFMYNPSGENLGRDSLNHSEVISLTAEFLLQKPMMQRILIQAYPILLIDESQDTNKALINAFFKVQKRHASNFTLGLFGDTMQRIYTDGEESLGQNIPEDWERPAKTINYRCSHRVIELINRIRQQVPGDSQQQTGWDQSEEGFVRLFVVQNSEQLNKGHIELVVKEQMTVITGDSEWADGVSPVKTLCLEHKMAAGRGGFFQFFSALANIKSSYTGLLDGKMRGIPFFTKQIVPLVSAYQAEDKFEVARIVRVNSPLLEKASLKSEPFELIARARDAVDALMILWSSDVPTLLEIIQEIHRSGLFLLPEELKIIASRSPKSSAAENDDRDDKQEEKVRAWENALQSNYSQIVAYSSYVSDESNFGTHQGIKGLEFPRVLIVLDDEAAGGFQWSYEKLFGVKPLTKNDHKNIKEDKETGVDRTRRLLYVTCSRAKKSLAVVAYTENTKALKQSALDYGWFKVDEIISLPTT